MKEAVYSPAVLAAVEAAITDDLILGTLDHCEQGHRNGDKGALFEALAVCARFQAVIPPWAADALLAAEKALLEGADFNEVFGHRSASATKSRKHRARIKKHRTRVQMALIRHRNAGGCWNAEEAFGQVSEELRLPRRLVEEIYRQTPNLKGIAQGNPRGTLHAVCNLPPLPLRRRGRPIL